MPRSKLLLFLVVLSVAAVIFLPVFTFTYLYPAVDSLLIRNSELQAEKVASHLTRYFEIPEDTLGAGDITAVLQDEIMEVMDDFMLEKVKVFSTSGEILYSTDRGDIGRFNDKDYFKSIVIRGSTFTKIVKKDSRTLEGRLVEKDVIETYVPLFGRDRVVGAFEIYYDITGLKKLFNNFVHRSTFIIYTVSAILLAALLVSLLKLSKNMAARDRAEKALNRNQQELEQLVEQRTSELSAANRKLQEDITKREDAEKALHASEKKYRALVEMAGDAIVVTEAETGIITDVNKEATQLVGLQAGDIIGMHILTLHPRDEEDMYRLLVSSHYKNPPHNKTLHVVHSSGRKVPVEISSAIFEYGGRTLMQGIFRDISQRLQVEEELQKAERLKTASILTGGIAHDFNNLLTAILGNISLAQREAASESKVRKRLEDTESAVTRAKELTHQLLTFAKGGTPVKKSVEIGRIVEDSALFVLHGSTVKCDCTVPDDLWPVEVDPGQLSQVINNLVINASHAMEDGGYCRVTVENAMVGQSDSHSLAPGRYVKISIHDEGHGIPKDKLDRIFDPFYTTKLHGSGLGLSSVYSIIKNHGGLVDVESEPGVGTTFDVYLPASENLPRKDFVSDEADLAGEGRILVMDDEEVVREAVTSILQYLEYEVDTALDGEAAIEMYKNAMAEGRPYAAVIMDLTVPGGMGGKEAVQKLRKIDPQARVIVSSGYYTDPIMANYRSYGFDGVVPKPYQMDELGGVVKELLRDQRM